MDGSWGTVDCTDCIPSFSCNRGLGKTCESMSFSVSVFGGEKLTLVDQEEWELDDIVVTEQEKTSSIWFNVAVEVFNTLSPFSRIVCSEDKVNALELKRLFLSSSGSFFDALKQHPSTSSSGRHCISRGLMGSKDGTEEYEGFLTCVARLTVEKSIGDFFAKDSDSSQLRSS